MNYLYPSILALLLVLGLAPLVCAADSGDGGAASSATSSSAGKPRVLVAYFSCTGTTETLAKEAAEELGADIYKITPQKPYSNDDLNYRNDKSRSSIEMNDASSRPAISGGVSDIKKYDIIFLGYPLWWGEAPRIINTFLETYDLSGKTFAPFCTSGSSGLGSSDRNLYASAKGASWVPGARISGNGVLKMGLNFLLMSNNSLNRHYA